jgi:transmembrane sensor
VTTERKWEPLGRKIEPRWGPERERVVRLAIARRERRRRVAIRVGMSLGLLAAVAGGLHAFLGLRTHAPTATASIPSAIVPPPSATATASVAVTQLSLETVLEPIADRPGRGFVLRSGGARFVASHDSDHPFLVVAGDVIVEDLGTTFTVQYLSDDKVDVAVEEGKVRVRARGADTELAAGQAQQFAVVSAAPASEQPPQPTSEPALSSWRVLAENGRYDEAQAALKKAGPSAVRDETADLLLAADAARLSGHAAAAVPYLERVLHSHSSDPRSNLAAFTLGRVLLDELGRPREAIDAFARARKAGGPLAEDALAREVEAAARAGDTARSRELAAEYQALYPNGRRAKAVSRFGGLD